jgi:fructose-1,6-bisphosphatase/sedoheptulose 1,7-bisphosphatase-like protein
MKKEEEKEINTMLMCIREKKRKDELVKSIQKKEKKK